MSRAAGAAGQVEATPNNFDGIRLLAALAVLVSHQFAVNGQPEPVFGSFISLGSSGVVVFFVISGTLVTRSWLNDPSLPRFAARRLLRIWPGLAAVTLACALMLGPWVSTLGLRDYLADPLLRDYARNLVFDLHDRLPLSFQGNAMPTSINSSLWSIPLEVECYVAVALLGSLGLLRRRFALLGAVLLVLLPYAVLDPRGETLRARFGWGMPEQTVIEFGLCFAAGACLELFGFGRAPSMSRRRLAWGAAALAGGGLAGLAGHLVLATWLVVPMMVVLVGTASFPVLRDLGRFGDLSYGVYIFAFPTQQTVAWLLRSRLPWGAELALVLVLTFGLALLSWHLVEKPALRLKPRSAAAA